MAFCASVFVSIVAVGAAEDVLDETVGAVDDADALDVAVGTADGVLIAGLTRLLLQLGF
jgi:hypothetical protein